MKIYRIQMGFLNVSTDQNQRTAQPGKTRKTKARFKTIELRKSTLRRQAKNSDSSSTTNARRSIPTCKHRRTIGTSK